MLWDTASVKIAELDTVMMKKANLKTDFAQLGVMPDTFIQEASPHFLSITVWKLLLMVSLAWDGSTVGGELAATRAGQPWKQIQGEGEQMAWVTTSLSVHRVCDRRNTLVTAVIKFTKSSLYLFVTCTCIQGRGTNSGLLIFQIQSLVEMEQTVHSLSPTYLFLLRTLINDFTCI